MAAAPDVHIQRIPVSVAKIFEGGLGGTGGFIDGQQDNTPMSRVESGATRTGRSKWSIATAASGCDAVPWILVTIHRESALGQGAKHRHRSSAQKSCPQGW